MEPPPLDYVAPEDRKGPHFGIDAPTDLPRPSFLLGHKSPPPVPVDSFSLQTNPEYATPSNGNGLGLQPPSNGGASAAWVKEAPLEAFPSGGGDASAAWMKEAPLEVSAAPSSSSRSMPPARPPGPPGPPPPPPPFSRPSTTLPLAAGKVDAADPNKTSAAGGYARPSKAEIGTPEDVAGPHIRSRLQRTLDRITPPQPPQRSEADVDAENPRQWVRLLNGSWRGPQAETYACTLEPGRPGKAMREGGKCKSNSSRFTLSLDEGASCVWWGLKKSFYLDLQELLRHPSQARWYAATWPHKMGFSWERVNGEGQVISGGKGSGKTKAGKSSPDKDWSKIRETSDRAKGSSKSKKPGDGEPQPAVIDEINSLGWRREWQSALQTLQELPLTGQMPTLPIYNAVLAALSRSRRWQEAIALLREMEAKGIQPDVTSYMLCMEACGPRVTQQAAGSGGSAGSSGGSAGSAQASSADGGAVYRFQ